MNSTDNPEDIEISLTEEEKIEIRAYINEADERISCILHYFGFEKPNFRDFLIYRQQHVEYITRIPPNVKNFKYFKKEIQSIYKTYNKQIIDSVIKKLSAEPIGSEVFSGDFFITYLGFMRKHYGKQFHLDDFDDLHSFWTEEEKKWMPDRLINAELSDIKLYYTLERIHESMHIYLESAVSRILPREEFNNKKDT